MANTSRVPAVIAQLVTQLDTALDVPVYDGPAFGEDAREQWVEIGSEDPEHQGGGGLTAVEHDIEWRGLGARSRDETGSVRCAAWSWAGDDDLSAVTSSVYALVGAAEAALFADPSLGGVALFGGVGNLILRRGRTPDGVMAGVLFDVRFKARLSA